MKMVESDNKNAPAVHLPWDAALDALALGTHDLAPPDGERGPDQPAAQSPAPGTEPFDASKGTPETRVVAPAPAPAPSPTVTQVPVPVPVPVKLAPTKV